MKKRNNKILCFIWHKVTDFAGCANFVVLAVLVLILRATYFTRQIVLTAFTILWALRLGTFLLIRVITRQKDERFDKMRHKFVTFLSFWVFQMVWVFTVSLPVTLNNSAVNDSPLNCVDYIGFTFWLIGFIIETVADQQKFSYTMIPDQRRPPFMSSGLWSLSRHPNYFGEILLWSGIFISSCNAYRVTANHMSFGYVSVVSPVLTFLLLMFVSGIPLAEMRAHKKYAKLAQYVDYKRSTSPLFLFPPQIYKRLPEKVKLIFFFEFPLYNKYFKAEYQPTDQQN